MVGKALNTQKPNAQYAYIAPFREQAKRVVWNYLLRAIANLPGIRTNIAELWVILPNGSKIMLFGADNPDAIRGIYLDGVVIDEPAQIRPRVFTEVIRPLLADREGWATYIGTPAGKNAFWGIWEDARLHPDRWFRMELRASRSGLLKQAELDDARRIMSEDEYEQEFECSFDAAIKGSYYGKILNSMGERLGDVPYDPSLPVHVVMDLGYTDSTSLWFWQSLGDLETHFIESCENSGLAIADYVDILRAKDYHYGDIYLPHDAKAKSLQTGRSLVEIMKSKHGIKPRMVPELSVQQGIQAARYLLTAPGTYIDAVNCEEGIEALRQYQREWDEKQQAFKEQPKHDWTSHYADAFRYSAIVAHKSAREAVNRITPVNTPAVYDPTKPFGGRVQLEKIWDTAARASRGERI
jgi:hypothetical protein